MESAATRARRGQAHKILAELRRKNITPLPDKADVLSVEGSCGRRDITTGADTFRRHEPSRLIYVFRLRGGRTATVEIML